MNTKVQETSITAYHDPERQQRAECQRVKIAEFLIKETKAGRAHCIATVSEALCLTLPALVQKSTVSARMNEIKKSGYNFKVQAYEMKHVTKKAAGKHGREADHYFMVLKQDKTEQLNLFQ